MENRHAPYWNKNRVKNTYSQNGDSIAVPRDILALRYMGPIPNPSGRKDIKNIPTFISSAATEGIDHCDGWDPVSELKKCLKSYLSKLKSKSRIFKLFVVKVQLPHGILIWSLNPIIFYVFSIFIFLHIQVQTYTFSTLFIFHILASICFLLQLLTMSPTLANVQPHYYYC